MMGNMPGFDQGYAQGFQAGYQAALQMSGQVGNGIIANRSETVATNMPKRRKVGKYQKTFGRNLKALKKKHPRTQINTLMKRAHRMTRRDLK